MSKSFLLHTTFLILSAASVFFWLSSPLEIYTFQLGTILVLLYLGSQWLKARKPKWFHKSTIPVDITILTCIILLLVIKTGALASPFFFLCYFLLFGVAMLYEIEATLVLTGVLILFFMFAETLNLTQIISLVMITPLAIFMGHEYESSLEEKQLREMLVKRFGNEQADTLKFLSLNLKKTLTKALDSLSTIIPTTRVKEARKDLQTLYSDLKVLYRTSTDLEKAIDQESKD